MSIPLTSLAPAVVTVLSTSTSTICSRTPVAALTSIFTPPASCPSPLVAQLSSCLPTKYSQYASGSCAASNAYYSPGICPSGYTAEPRPNYASGDAGPPITSGETGAMCCPPPYTISTASCWKSNTDSAVAIQIRWQSSDLSILETHPMSPGVKYTPSTTAAATSSFTPSITSKIIGKTSDAAVESGLGPGGKAGIGIGAALGVLALLAIGFLIWRRRHRYNAVRNTSDEAGHEAPEIVSRNWNEGHDLPVVVQDKKSPVVPSAEASPNPGKFSKFFTKKSPAPTTPIVLSGRTSPNGKEVVPNNEPSPALPQHTGIYSSPTPRQSQQFVPDSGLEVAEHQSPTHPAASHAELEALRHEHQRIQDERQRLSRMQALDEEERRVRQRIEQISSPR